MLALGILRGLSALDRQTQGGRRGGGRRQTTNIARHPRTLSLSLSLSVDVEIRGFVRILIYEGVAIDFHGLTMHDDRFASFSSGLLDCYVIGREHSDLEVESF